MMRSAFMPKALAASKDMRAVIALARGLAGS